MKTVKYAVADKNLPIFKKHLDNAGLSFTLEDRLEFTVLVIKSGRMSYVQRIIDAASAEVRASSLYRFGGAA